MKEKDILWEGDNLWIGKTSPGEFTLFKNGLTYSTGFLQFTNLEQAIDNGRSLDNNARLIEKLSKG